MTRPFRPSLVFALGMAMPGMGQAAAGEPRRGLGFALVTLAAMLIGFHLTTSDQPLVARSAPGLFVWLLAAADAWHVARLREALWQVQISAADSAPAAQSER